MNRIDKQKKYLYNIHLKRSETMIKIYNTEQFNLYDTIVDYQLLLTLHTDLKQYISKNTSLQTDWFTKEQLDQFIKEHGIEHLVAIKDFITGIIRPSKNKDNLFQPLKDSFEIQAIPIEFSKLGDAELCTYEQNSELSKNAIIVTEHKILMQQNEFHKNTLYYLSPLQDTKEIQKILTFKNSLK